MATDKTPNQHYALIWRWHFYAGILIAPLLMVLAITGLSMMVIANIHGKDGDKITVSAKQTPLPLSQQAHGAIHAIGEGSTITQYLSPHTKDTVAIFRVNTPDDKAYMVAIDPYTAKAVAISKRNHGAYYFFDELHSDLKIGKVGDYLLETAASLTVLMILTGLYLWWVNRQRRLLAMLTFDHKPQGRPLWKNWHGILGTYVSVMLLVFCISGMAWAGIWGEKMVQAWSQFPAGKWGVPPNPQSVVLHGNLNDGKHKNIPWALELTPMPTSTNTAPNQAFAGTLESVDALARQYGFVGRYQIYFPKGETGVWTINQDSMSHDSPSPTADRTLHLDCYTGKVLADIRFDDYNAFGKFMAVSLAFHMGTMGLWSVGLNAIFCLAVIYLCVSGFVMWYKRRPSQAIGLCPPAQKPPIKFSVLAVILLMVACMFPTALIAILVVGLIDWALISRSAFLNKHLK